MSFVSISARSAANVGDVQKPASMHWVPRSLSRVKRTLTVRNHFIALKISNKTVEDNHRFDCNKKRSYNTIFALLQVNKTISLIAHRWFGMACWRTSDVDRVMRSIRSSRQPTYVSINGRSTSVAVQFKACRIVGCRLRTQVRHIVEPKIEWLLDNQRQRARNLDCFSQMVHDVESDFTREFRHFPVNKNNHFIIPCKHRVSQLPHNI
jgi:hypothetical protein